MRTALTSPFYVEVYNRLGEAPAKIVEWCPMDTVADSLERAGFETCRVTGVTMNTHYIRGFQTEPTWPNSTIVVDTV